MRKAALVTLAALLIFPAGCQALAQAVNFDDMKQEESPAGWTAGQTGKGAAKWEVVADPTAPSQPNALKQSGEATYPVCILNTPTLRDGYVEVKFKALSGKADQAAGVIWRCADTNNYYVARANALEDNVTAYHTVKGKRTEKKRVDIKVSPMAWHKLRVDFTGSRFKVNFDGKTVLEWEDETFKAAGKVGLWTKADSVTLFDDFRYGEN